MAIAFLAASSEQLYNDTAVVADAPVSMSCLFRINDITGDYCLVGIGDKDASNQFHMLNVAGSVDDSLRVSSRGGGSTRESIAGSAYSADTWYHGGGVWASTSSRLVYFDGVAGTEDTNSETLTGNDRIVLGARPNLSEDLDGQLAEVGIWNVALTAAEMASLAKGYSPLFIRPQSLIFYMPLVRNLSNDLVGGLSMTAGGTPTAENHPTVIYPEAQRIFVPAAAPAGAGNPYYAYAQQ